MRKRKLTWYALLPGLLATVLQAGPAISCKWIAVPGSVFEALDPLRQIAMAADDSPANQQQARARLVQLRAAIKPGDALSLLTAGFWVTTMHDIRVSEDAGGPGLILKALELRPNDPEYQFFAALAYMPSDKVRFRKHWNRARELAKPGSATAINMGVVTALYPETSGP